MPFLFFPFSLSFFSISVFLCDHISFRICIHFILDSNFFFFFKKKVQIELIKNDSWSTHCVVFRKLRTHHIFFAWNIQRMCRKISLRKYPSSPLQPSCYTDCHSNFIDSIFFCFLNELHRRALARAHANTTVFHYCYFFIYSVELLLLSRSILNKWSVIIFRKVDDFFEGEIINQT